jgi:hypothetical protein
MSSPSMVRTNRAIRDPPSVAEGGGSSGKAGPGCIAAGSPALSSDIDPRRAYGAAGDFGDRSDAVGDDDSAAGAAGAS